TTIHNKLKKRLLNVKSPQKRQGPAQERGCPKKRRCLDLSASDSGKDYDADSSDAVARSGRRLPNYTADQRSSMVIRSPNSHQGAKKQLVMSELRRLLDKDNHKYIAEVKKRWDDFVAKVQFYGVSKKAMKPPMTLDGGTPYTLSFTSCTA
ncbi:hypothetical protein NQZ68_038409, partial [Dissostichus eleginoides]